MGQIAANEPDAESDPWPRLSRFELVRRLGEGSVGIVYEAVDRERGACVALKTLKRADGHDLLHLKDEFRALQDIQHPNLVALGEMVCDGDTWLFTMELVYGVGFVEHITREPTRRPPGETSVTAPFALRVDGGRA